LCDKLAAEHPRVRRSISVTTRPQRKGEVSGQDYIFVSREDFQQKKAAGHFLETAEVFGNWYGTPIEPVKLALDEGFAIVMDIDTVGALRIEELMPADTVMVFVLPPSIEELERRLVARGKNTADELERRLKEARREIAESSRYQYRFENREFDRAYATLVEIVEKEFLARQKA
jgi:guanylate kinase